MKKILRKMATQQNRTFWESAERAAAEVNNCPARREPREEESRIVEETSLSHSS